MCDEPLQNVCVRFISGNAEGTGSIEDKTDVINNERPCGRSLFYTKGAVS